MSTFELKCPKCGIDLEAEEADLGAKVSCPDCDYHFVLKQSNDSVLALHHSTEELSLEADATFNLENPVLDLAHSKPDHLQINDHIVELKSWKEVLFYLSQYIYDHNPSHLYNLCNHSFSNFTKRICIQSTNRNLISGMKIAEDLWIETNFSANHVIRLAAEIATACKLKLDGIKIKYHWAQTKGNNSPSTSVSNLCAGNSIECNTKNQKSNIVESSGLFLKKVDWSTLTMGITIPVKLQNAFLQHLSVSLPRGSSMPVSICVEGTEYRVSMVNVGFSDSTRRQVIQILWSRKSPMAEMLRIKFPTAYQQLSKNHSNRDGIEDVIIVACGYKRDVFNISFLQSNEIKEMIPKNEVENKASCGCVQRLLSININRGNQYHAGEASHKPIMCITLIYAIDKKLTAENLFYKKSLLPIFRKIWNLLGRNGIEGNIWIPFKYLVNDGFWTINNDGSGSLEREMYEFLSVSQNRIDSVNAILQTFFEHIAIDVATLWNQLAQLPPNELPYDKDESERVRMVFNQHFTSGIRPGSIIDKNRFKRYYCEDTGSNLREDFPLDASLLKIGMLHEGKVFPLLSPEGAIWRTLVDELLTNGHCLLAYSRVMELHTQELMASGIASADMLHDLIVHDANDVFEIGSRYFAIAGSSLNLADVIATNISENTLFVSETELCRQYPYICKEDIHHVLVSDLRYVWNCRDIYVVGSRLIFDDSEADCILSEIRSVVSTGGYCSLAHFDFIESMSLNDSETTVNAVRRVFFSRYLANEFDKHGQIVSRKGKKIDGKIPLREFCRKHSEVMLEQVYAVANNFNITDYLVMTMMHEEMVRVELERFVASSQVTFDTVLIDHALNTCFHDKVMPFGAFRDFLQFPAVPGWSWNQYLLEAFLRRSSRAFRLLTPSVASREVAGVVVRKDDAIDDILDACAIVAVNAGLPDDDAVVGDYLLKNGCILRRRASMIAEITTRMNMIYERMK